MPKDRTDVFSVSVLSGIRVFRSLAAGFINLMFPYLVLTELAPEIQASGLNPTLLIALIYTTATIASAVLGIVMGYAADLLGRKRTYLIALALLPVSTAILLITKSIPALFVAAALGGFSATGSLASGGVGGVAAPIQSALLTDLTARRQRTFYYGLLAFFSAIFGAVGVALAGIISTDTTLAVTTVLSGISVFLGLALRAPPNRSRRGRMRTGKVIGQFSLTGMLSGLSQGLLTPWLIPFFIIVFGIPKGSMGILGFIASIFAAFALLSAPYFERRFGFLGSVYLTRGLTIGIALAWSVTPFLPTSLGLFLALGFYLSYPSLRVVSVPVQRSAMMDMVDEGERGRAFGISQASRLSMSAGGTAVSGYAISADALPVPFTLYAVAMSVSLLLYHRFFSSYRAPAELRRPTPSANGGESEEEQAAPNVSPEGRE